MKNIKEMEAPSDHETICKICGCRIQYGYLCRACEWLEREESSQESEE